MKTEVSSGEVAGDCGDDTARGVEYSPLVGKMGLSTHLVLGQLFRLIKETDLDALKREVLERVLPRFRAFPFMDDEELIAGVLKMHARGQDPRFPIKRTKSAKLIYDGKNADLIGCIIRRAWPERGFVLQYDDTTDDDDTVTLDHAYDGRVVRGSLSKSDRAFQAVEAYLRQKESKHAIKAAGGRPKSQAQLAAESGVSPTYVEDLLRVRRRSEKLYALVGERKITVKSAAEIADDEDENTWAGLLKLFEGCSHLTDDEARRLLGEYRAAKASRKLRGGSAADNPPAVVNGAETSIEPDRAQPPPDGQIKDSDGGRAREVADADPAPSTSPDRLATGEQAEINAQGPTSAPVGQEQRIEREAADDPGVFNDSLRALARLQGLLSGCRATPALIEALEITLKAARERLL
jgi:hypothetical protein